MLVTGLPHDSALHRQGKQWTLDHELAAVGIELVQMWHAMQIGMWMKKGDKVPDIVPITHPDRPLPERKKKVATIDQIARQFGGGR